MVEQLLIGVVKWYNDVKGFGFISQEDARDLVVHRSAIVGERTYLHEGDRVIYQVESGPKGEQARNVKVIG